MRAIRARAIRKLEREQAACRKLGLAKAYAALTKAVNEARAGGPNWRRRASAPLVEIELEGDAYQAQAWLRAAEAALR